MYQRSWIKKNRAHPRKTTEKTRYRAFYLWLVLCGVSVFAFLYFAQRDEYQIKQTVVTNAFITDESTVKEIVSEILGQKYFFLLPKSNFYFFPKQYIENEILKLPSVLSTDINLDRSNHILYVDIKDKKHEFLWCSSNSDCFYMDRSGYIFAPSPKFEGNIFIRFSGMVDGEPVGAHFMPEPKLKGILDFIGALSDLKFPVRSVNVVSQSEVMLELISRTYLIVSLDDNLSTVLKNFKTLVASKDFLVATGGMGNVSKLDLRYGTRGFWTPKQ